MSGFVGRNNAKISNRPSGGGDKLQGMPATTDKRASSIRAIQNRAWGENRNLIFNINQLGGVGRHRSQFLSNAGGVSGPNIENPEAGGNDPPPNPSTDIVVWNSNNIFPLTGIAIGSSGEGSTTILDYGNVYSNTQSSIIYGSQGNNPQISYQTSTPDVNFFRLPFCWYANSGPNPTPPHGFFTGPSSPSEVNINGPADINPDYVSSMITGIKNLMSLKSDAVVMLDCHCYSSWGETTTTPSDPINETGMKLVWLKILQELENGGLKIKDNLQIFLELQNEPHNVTDYADFWQETIDALRTVGYNNKLVLGGQQGGNSCGKFIAYDGYSDNPGNKGNGFANYSGNFPNDLIGDQPNFCITLHNYVDRKGGGTDYQNQLPKFFDGSLTPSWPFTSYIFDMPVLNAVIAKGYDIILGETGIPNSHAAGTQENYQRGIDSLNHLLGANFLSTPSVNLDPITYKGNYSSADILKQNFNGKVLGYALWNLAAHPNTDDHSYGDGELVYVVSNFTTVDGIQPPPTTLIWTVTDVSGSILNQPPGGTGGQDAPAGHPWTSGTGQFLSVPATNDYKLTVYTSPGAIWALGQNPNIDFAAAGTPQTLMMGDSLTAAVGGGGDHFTVTATVSVL